MGCAVGFAAAAIENARNLVRGIQNRAIAEARGADYRTFRPPVVFLYFQIFRALRATRTSL